MHISSLTIRQRYFWPDSAYAPSDAFDVPLEPQQPQGGATNEPTISSPTHSDISVRVRATLTLPTSSPNGTVLELSPIATVSKDPFKPVVQPKSLNNTFDKIKDQGSVTIDTNSELELSDLGVPSQDDVPLLFMTLGSENIVLVSESEINISANLLVCPQ